MFGAVFSEKENHKPREVMAQKASKVMMVEITLE